MEELAVLVVEAPLTMGLDQEQRPELRPTPVVVQLTGGTQTVTKARGSAGAAAEIQENSPSRPASCSWIFSISMGVVTTTWQVPAPQPARTSPQRGRCLETQSHWWEKKVKTTRTSA